jgi:hypothetical protein
MTVESYESGNRRAEIDDVIFSVFRVSGHVRHSKIGVWKVNTDDVRRARRLAKRSAFKGRLGESVLH